MATCEKCWRDSGGYATEYRRLLEERDDSPCTPEQQAGPDAMICALCRRATIHQHVGTCVICGSAEYWLPGEEAFDA